MRTAKLVLFIVGIALLAGSASAQTVVSNPGGGVTIQAGTIAGDILQWLGVVLGPVIATAVGAVLVKWLKKLGVDVDDANRKRLDDMIQNGIALGAQRAQANLAGRVSIDVKNMVAADAVTYVQRHGAETLKALGFPDPLDPKAIEALQARAADELNKVTAAMTPDVVPSPLPIIPGTTTTTIVEATDPKKAIG